MSKIRDVAEGYVIRFRLDAVLAERGIPSHRQAAGITGIHHNTLNRLAKDAKQVDLKTLLRLCLSLKASPNDFFEIDVKGDGNEKTPHRRIGD